MEGTDGKSTVSQAAQPQTADPPDEGELRRCDDVDQLGSAEKEAVSDADVAVPATEPLLHRSVSAEPVDHHPTSTSSRTSSGRASPTPGGGAARSRPAARRSGQLFVPSAASTMQVAQADSPTASSSSSLASLAVAPVASSAGVSHAAPTSTPSKGRYFLHNDRGPGMRADEEPSERGRGRGRGRTTGGRSDGRRGTDDVREEDRTPSKWSHDRCDEQQKRRPQQPQKQQKHHRANDGNDGRAKHKDRAGRGGFTRAPEEPGAAKTSTRSDGDPAKPSRPPISATRIPSTTGAAGAATPSIPSAADSRLPQSKPTRAPMSAGSASNSRTPKAAAAGTSSAPTPASIHHVSTPPYLPPSAVAAARPSRPTRKPQPHVLRPGAKPFVTAAFPPGEAPGQLTHRNAAAPIVLVPQDSQSLFHATAAASSPEVFRDAPSTSSDLVSIQAQLAQASLGGAGLASLLMPQQRQPQQAIPPYAADVVSTGASYRASTTAPTSFRSWEAAQQQQPPIEQQQVFGHHQQQQQQHHWLQQPHPQSSADLQATQFPSQYPHHFAPPPPQHPSIATHQLHYSSSYHHPSNEGRGGGNAAEGHEGGGDLASHVLASHVRASYDARVGAPLNYFPRDVDQQQPSRQQLQQLQQQQHLLAYQHGYDARANESARAAYSQAQTSYQQQQSPFRRF